MRLALLLLLSLSVQALEPIIQTQARVHPVYAPDGMVVSQDSLATDTALRVLKEGGNAADAAVALAYVLAVTQPKAGNLGGGGFALYYDSKKQKTIAIDFRETAPAKAHKDIFLDKNGNVDQLKSRFSLAASAVPGTVAGLEYIRKNFGSTSHKELIKPAYEYAKNGFPISPGLAYDLKQSKDVFLKSPYLRKIFAPNNKMLRQNEILIQKDLAQTLKKLKEQGPSEFYEGTIAQVFCNYFKKNNGLITQKDMLNYKVKTRKVVEGKYRNYTITSMPAPSSGGIHLIQMLNILENWDLTQAGHNSASTLHIMTEAMKFAYADRSKFLADPDFYEVPEQGLISKKYAAILAQKVQLEQATPAIQILPGQPANYESPETTHFSIADKYGNVISLTYTINFSFGSRRIIPGLGFFLNNEMDDFSAKTGTANAYGLIGSEANAVSPGKRPLSSMAPTIVFKNNKPWLICGSPGGSRIITATLQVILNCIDHKMNIAEAVLAPRIHHQWLPDILNIESGISPDTINLLHLLGHSTLMNKTSGCVEAIMIDKNIKYGFADPRRIDGKAAGH